MDVRERLGELWLGCDYSYDPFSNPLFALRFGPIPAGGKSKDWLESRGPG